jgi:hypothetical protein
MVTSNYVELSSKLTDRMMATAMKPMVTRSEIWKERKPITGQTGSNGF